MTPDQWYTLHKGTAILIPNGGKGNDGQCVQAMDSYLFEVYKQPYVYALGAIDIWKSGIPGFTKIVSPPTIELGDFVFWDSRIGSKFGHVDMCSRPGPLSNFWAYDSNWGGKAFYNDEGYPILHEVRHNDILNDYILGVLRKENMPTLVDDGNIDLLYVSVLHRHAGQADKDARRGQDYLKAQTELYESLEWANQDQLIKNPNPSYKSVGEAFVKA